MADQPGGQLERWLSIGGSIIAPATAITTLLFYFGYVSSRAQYDYFGVDVDLVGLTTRDYVMRSPQPLLVPLLVITLGCALLLGVHTLVRRRVTEADRLRRLARRSVAAGLVLLVVGVALLFLYPLIGVYRLYPLVTPLVLVAGGSVVGWGLLQLRRLDAEATQARGVRRAVDARDLATVLVWVAVAAAVFWATATIAGWSGRGLAKEQARDLGTLPSVILDTKEPLFLQPDMGVEERGWSRSRRARSSATATGTCGCSSRARIRCSWSRTPGTPATPRCSSPSTATCGSVSSSATTHPEPRRGDHGGQAAGRGTRASSCRCSRATARQCARATSTCLPRRASTGSSPAYRT